MFTGLSTVAITAWPPLIGLPSVAVDGAALVPAPPPLPQAASSEPSPPLAPSALSALARRRNARRAMSAAMVSHHPLWVHQLSSSWSCSTGATSPQKLGLDSM